MGREGGRILRIDGNGGSKLKVRVKEGGREWTHCKEVWRGTVVSEIEELRIGDW